MTTPVIVIPELSSFIRAIGTIEPDFRKTIRDELKEAAQGIVRAARADYAQHYRVGGSGRRSRRTADTIRALAGVRETKVAVGGARYPYVFGQEFGSAKYPQFRPWTGPAPGGRGSHGRFLWPNVREGMDDVAKAMEGIFDRAARKAFPEAR